MASYTMTLCFLTWQANDLMDTSLDHLLDMTIPCLSIQLQSFSIFTIGPAQIIILWLLQYIFY